MPHHFTKSTTEAMIFCRRCMAETLWKVADGRRQYCIPCFQKDQARYAEAEAMKRRKKEEAARQGGLFDAPKTGGRG